MKRNQLFIARGIATCALACALFLPGCTHRVKVDPIKVEPIDITLHIYLKADEKLDSFFDYQDEQPLTPSETPAAPSAPPASPTNGAPPLGGTS